MCFNRTKSIIMIQIQSDLPTFHVVFDVFHNQINLVHRRPNNNFPQIDHIWMSPTLHEHVDLSQRSNRESFFLVFHFESFQSDNFIRSKLKSPVGDSKRSFFYFVQYHKLVDTSASRDSRIKGGELGDKLLLMNVLLEFEQCRTQLQKQV